MTESARQAKDSPIEVVRHALRERVKELSCLYDVSAFLSDGGRASVRRLQAVVDRLPAGWQYPEKAAARLTVDDESYESARWAPSPNGLRAEIHVDGAAVGALEVVYSDAKSESAGVAFLEEERLLIVELARRVGEFLQQEWGRERTRSLEERLEETPEPRFTRETGTGPQGLIGASEAMQDVYRAIEKVAQTDATILIYGESGTGKELVARAIHYGSARSTEPFVPVNCAAIPESLVESELFGYVKGAFTGASHARAGFFQTAQGGTIFLDEIGEMAPAAQAKLLRVLENNEIRMVGSDRTVRADARIVAATNKEVASLVKANRFRADLFFRLNVLSIELPPLRERGDDLQLLLEHFRQKWGPGSGRPPLSFSDRALRALRGYDWPGNVRELENLVQRLAIMVDGGFVDVSDLPGLMRFPSRRPTPELCSLAEFERRHVRSVLHSVGGNRSEAARILGIDRKTLRKKLGPSSGE